MVLLVKQLHRLRIFIEGEHRPWVILVPDNAFPIIVSFDRDADLFCDALAVDRNISLCDDDVRFDTGFRAGADIALKMSQIWGLLRHSHENKRYSNALP